MRKDPTEFRKRFQSWKLGIPAYEDGKPIDYTKVAQESRDREYNTAMSYFKSTPNVLNIARGVYHFAKSTPLFGDTPASVNPNMIYGDAPAVGYRNATNLAETTRRIKAAVKPFVNGVSNTKLSTQALQQEIRYGDTYYPEQLTIAERNAMAKLRQSKLAKEKGKYMMVDNAPKVGLKNYVLMENGKPQAEMIASMEDGSIIPEMVYKTNKAAHHTTTDLYSGVLKYQKQAGNTGGIISGESYKSAPATLKQVKKFKKEKVSDNGTWDNEGLVGYDQEPTVVKNMEEADKLNKKGKAFILYNQPIYRLLQPVKDIPIKDRYMFDPRRIGPNGEYNVDMSNPSRFAQNQDDSNQRHYFKGGKDLPRFADGDDLGSSAAMFGSVLVASKNRKENQARIEQNKKHDQKIAQLKGYGWSSPMRTPVLTAVLASREINPAWRFSDYGKAGAAFVTGNADMDNATQDDINYWHRHLGFERDYDSMPVTGIRFSGDYNNDGSLRLPNAEYTGLSKTTKDFIRKGVENGDIEVDRTGKWTLFKEGPRSYAKYTSHMGDYSIRENNGSGIYDVFDTYDFPWYSPVFNRDIGKQIEIRDTIYGANANPVLYDPMFSKSYKSGKDIYIKPSHRGRFTALKKRTGHSASWFKAHGTPALKKMATFALNARKWKH